MIILNLILTAILIFFFFVISLQIIRTWRFSLAKSGTRIYRLDIKNMTIFRGENNFISKRQQFKIFKFRKNIETVSNFKTLFTGGQAELEFEKCLAKIKKEKVEFYERSFETIAPRMQIGKRTLFQVKFSF